MNDHWEVYALKYSQRNERTRHDSFIFGDNHDAPHAMDYFIWLLRNGSRSILVDTGYDSAEGIARNRPIIEEPADLLKRFGVAPDTIDTVIITHLHYDHAGSLPEFTHADFHLQTQEMAYATGPCMCHDTLKMPYTGEHICAAVRQLFAGRLMFHEGSGEVAPGVEVHLIGGHSRGLQCVRVKTTRGWLVLASDASHYYENFLSRTPFPIVVDMEEMLAGFTSLYNLAESVDHIIPGHDPLVRDLYPGVFESDDSVVRLDLPPARSIKA
ncbi:MBL fold hydrolase [Chromatiales bacterium (ex Bugula neritina AB1)]|nr:MBL fold hydrolase [Chromatiales bacterium (ex Bugula neritina AB1)]